MKELIQNNKKFLLLSSLVVLLTALTAISAPLIVQFAVGSQRLLLYIFGAMSLSFVIQLFAIHYRENYAATFNVTYLFQLIHKMTRLTYDAYVHLEPTYLINRIFTAVDALYLFLINSCSAVINAVFMLLCSLLLAGSVSLKIFWLLLVLIPINYFGFRWINRTLSHKMAQMQTASAIANKDLVVTLTNADAVKAGMNDELLDHVLKANIQTMYQTLANTNKFAQSTSGLLQLINQLTQNLLYIWTSVLITEGELPLTSLIILSIVLPLFFSALSGLTQANIDWRTLRTANDFIKNDLDANQEKISGKKIAAIQSVRLTKPAFTFQAQAFAFNFDEQLLPGDVVYLKGASGSGKSTFLKLLLKFRTAAGIWINELPSTEIDAQALRQRIAYLSQDPTLLSATIEENVTFGRQLSSAQKEFLQQTKILAPIFQTKSWDTVLVENGSNLSGGEKQRLAAARLLLTDADLYLLDESTSNIDQASAKAIFETLLTCKKDKIILFTSHDTRNQKYANKILTIGGTDE